MLITLVQLEEIFPGGRKRLPLYLGILNKYLEKYSINTPLRISAFLAQVGHESMEFRFTRELGGDSYLNKMYDTRKDLGNTGAKDGDGALYCGRGLIQVTGKANYEAMSKKLFGDTRLLKTPSILQEPEWAVASACQFWGDKKLNELADKGEFKKITKLINGGYNHLEERQEYYERAKKALGIK